MGEYIAESEVLRRALGTYGSVLQIVVTMEEMSELQKELCKNLRGRGSIEFDRTYCRGDCRCGDHARTNEDAVFMRG